MEKKHYESPEMDIIRFASEDVITASCTTYNPSTDETQLVGP